MADLIFNTGETPDDLKKEYNPEGSLKRRIQTRLLDMLIYFDKVCKEIGVDYRLDSGLVLGAIRHEGFIPWDDDIDVAIDNHSDYKRLCNYLRKHPHSQYVLQDETTDKYHIKYWSTLRDLKSEYIHLDEGEDRIDRMLKYRGLQIDIFPCDKGIIRPLYLNYAKLNRKETWALFENKYYKMNAIHSIRKYICNPILRCISRLWGDSQYIMYSYGLPFKYRYIPKDVLLPHRPILFEGMEFPGPAQPERYCEIIYGDYMNLPPAEVRNNHNVTYRIWD